MSNSPRRSGIEGHGIRLQQVRTASSVTPVATMTETDKIGQSLQSASTWQKKKPRLRYGAFRTHSGERAYLLIIFRLAAAIIALPSFSVTSPVRATVLLRWGTSFAFFSAARSPVTA